MESWDWHNTFLKEGPMSDVTRYFFYLLNNKHQPVGNTPESSQCALVRAVVGGVVGEEGQVVAVELKLDGDDFG